MLRLFATASMAILLASSGFAQNCIELPVGNDLNLTDDSISAAQNLGFTFT